MACAAPHDPADHGRDEQLARASSQMQKAFLVVDTASAHVQEANAAGRLLLGISLSRTLPAALDSAMPAMQRLRQIASGQNPRERETLTFWSNGQLAALTCSVKPVNANGSRHLMELVELDQQLAEALVAAEPQPIERHVAVTPSDEVLPAVKPRDDAETLREIARRIREGQQANLNAPAGATRHREDMAVRPEYQAAAVSSATDARTPAFSAEPAVLAKLAHELRTPLSAIVAASEIMRDQRLGLMGNELYLGYAGDIHKSAMHALAVITNMLEAANSSTNQKVQICDLVEITAATVSAMQPLAHARGLYLAHESDESRLELNAHPTAIRQILFNLLANATKFTNAGGTIHAGTGYLPDGSIYLVVRDTGEGMDEATLARAFYDNSDGTVRRRGGGFGFGLPMVRRLAEANRGVIEIDSAPDKGTVVLISFPDRH